MRFTTISCMIGISLLASMLATGCAPVANDPKPCPEQTDSIRVYSAFVIDDGDCEQPKFDYLWPPFCDFIRRFDSVSSVSYCTNLGTHFYMEIAGENKCPGPVQDLAIDSVYVETDDGLYTEIVSDTIFSSACVDWGPLYRRVAFNYALVARDPVRNTTIWLHDGWIAMQFRR